MDFTKLKKLKLNTKTKWIVFLSAIVVVIIAGVFLYQKSTTKVFTQQEYVKEVIIQNDNFNNLLDEFLDQVANYNGTVESTKKIEETASRFNTFYNGLETKLKPRVPSSSKDHYNKMLDAYKTYLDAIEMYKKALPKKLSDERNQLLSDARNKLNEAKETMKNLK
ncbi:MAG: hypothetical protein IJJ04_01085 [Clostridia bacterium]|nr:hypothetical protein [Clostridia bacterium]